MRHNIICTYLFYICLDSPNNMRATLLLTVKLKMTIPHWTEINYVGFYCM